MFRRNKRENKAKLEHKLYLVSMIRKIKVLNTIEFSAKIQARETPEPVFDLSDCGITQVPSGIYSLCRVFLKECLKLDNNNLSSFSGGGSLKDLHLLKILDVHVNDFNTLPNDIDSLVNLKVSAHRQQYVKSFIF